MSTVIEQLADALIPVSQRTAHGDVSSLPENLQDTYVYFLSLCDGGYTQDRFLHFMGLEGDPRHRLTEWNSVGSWKKYYGLDESCFVFAQDFFGSQYFFDIRGTRKVVKMLLPSTGQTSLYTNSFEEFVEEEGLSVTYSDETRQLAKKFLEAHSLSALPFTHISCKKPVILGGSELDLENLEVSDSLTNLMLTGQVVDQVKKMPKGTRIDAIRIENS